MLRVTTVFIGPPGAPYYSVFYFGGTTEGEASAAIAATDTWWAGFEGGLRTDMAGTVLGDVELVDPVTGNITGVFTDTPAALDFSAAGDPLPMATQLLVRWRTGVFVDGREIRGRTFVPGYTETSSSLGAPAATTITGVNGLVDTFLTAAAPAGGHVVYSPTHGQAAATSGGSTWSQWAVLRSRRD